MMAVNKFTFILDYRPNCVSASAIAIFVESFIDFDKITGGKIYLQVFSFVFCVTRNQRRNSPDFLFFPLALLSK